MSNQKITNPKQMAEQLKAEFGKGALKLAKEKRFLACSIATNWYWDEVIKQLKYKNATTTTKNS